MRPKSRILIVGSNEDRLGVLAFLLSTNAYAVTCASSIDNARELTLTKDWELLIVDLPLDNVQSLLLTARAAKEGQRTLALAPYLKFCPEGLFVDCFLPGKITSAEMLERLKVLCARKRGPRPLRKLVESAPVIALESRIA